MPKITKKQLEEQLKQTKEVNKGLSTQLVAQRLVSTELSERVTGLESDRDYFRFILEEVGAILFFPKWLQSHSLTELGPEVKRIQSERDIHKGAAQIASTMHREIVDKLVQTVEKYSLQNKSVL